jgi:hypothetical protein
MHRLLIKLCVMAALLAVAASWQALSYSDKKNYLASNLDKHSLLDSARGPRIILVGGSNLAFGVNSGAVSRALGRPVINMGVSAGLGLKYMLNEVEPYLREEDWVVLSPEYQQFYGNMLDGREALGKLIAIEPGCARYLSPDQYLRTLSYSLVYLSSAARRRLGKSNERADSIAPSTYRRGAYNEWGDHTAHLWVSPRAVVPHLIEGDQNHEAVEIINRFAGRAARKKAKVFMVHPGYWRVGYQLNKAKIDALTAELPTRLQVKILSRPEEFLFEQAYLFDTEYHLNASGIKVRTRKLIALLNREKYAAKPGLLVYNQPQSAATNSAITGR